LSNHDSPELKAAVPKGLFRKITEEQLAACQFSGELRDEFGVIRMPEEWASSSPVTNEESAVDQ
jgi:hypothetical protein